MLSSELGYRKPSPVIYREALRRLGHRAAATLFVGDRVLEDVVGPSREGMPPCLAESGFAADAGDHGLADRRARLSSWIRARRPAVPTG